MALDDALDCPIQRDKKQGWHDQFENMDPKMNKLLQIIKEHRKAFNEVHESENMSQAI